MAKQFCKRLDLQYIKWIYN